MIGLLFVGFIFFMVFVAFKDNKENLQADNGLGLLRQSKTKQKELKSLIPAEKERLNLQLQQLTDRHENTLNTIVTSLNSSVLTLTAYELLAHYQATEEVPRLFNEVFDKKYKTLATTFNRADGLDRTSDTPPSLVTLPWHDRHWTPSQTDENSYSPQTDGLAPEMLRIGNLLRMGTLSLEQFRPETEIPAFVPIRCLSPHLNSKMPGRIVIFSNDVKSRQAAVSAIESIALRLISTFPVRKLQGIFIDPVSMGNSFPFKSLPKHIVGQQTYTRTDDVREQLRKLTVHTEQIIQNYLSRYYQSIEEYNAVKSAVEEAYRYLFVADFPTNFDNTSWEDLKSLLLNGSKAGVYAGLFHSK
jgi:DNA segregation ATPase FtsK/SpoIIIE, S-DNA-T family